MEFFQTGFIHFRPFSATLGSAGRKAPSQEPNGQFFRLNLSISGNFQQLWVQLAAKLPPRGQTGKHFRWYLFISGNFQQLWVQLAVKPPSRKTGLFYSGSIHFMQFPATWPLVCRKIPNPGTKWNFLQTEFIHLRPFSATLVSAGS